MRKATIVLFTIIIVAACQKNLKDADNTAQLSGENQLKKPGTPPVNANPAFAFTDNYQVNPNRVVPAIFVMDVTGANKTKVYSNYTNQATRYPDHPAWSGDGAKLCFTLNSADLYTLNISLVNGIPTGFNPTKIGDGVAGGGSYKQGKWRPGANQIACVWKKGGEPDKIHLLTTSGGSPTILYAAQNSDWVIEDDIAFKSDGSNLVFSERQISTGYIFLKVLDLGTNTIIKSIDLSEYRFIREIDWARSSGSNIVAITTVPHCDGTSIGNGGIHQLHTIDVGATSPSLTWLRDDVGNISWSPNDAQITTHAGLGRACNPATGCCSSQYYAIGIITVATQGYSIPGNNPNSNHPDWKRQ